MPGPPKPRRHKAQDTGPAQANKKRKPTKGEKAKARDEARRRRKAHQAGLRAIRRERWNQFREWVWPATTRDVGKGRAVAVLVLNIAPFPGLGTALYGRIERGLLQFLLTFLFLVGWVWAIADGLRIVHRAYAGPDPRRARPTRTR